jgi:glycosyltransferase involved in cell wall biosynthesis
LLHKLTKKGINRSLVTIIRNGVDTNEFNPHTTHSISDKFVVTYAGSFLPWQGIGNLARAAKQIKDPNISFKIIGFKPKDKQIKNLLYNTLGNRAELIDLLDKPELIRQMQASNIFIIPRNNYYALRLAFPSKFAEYISVGKPVIVTDVDESADFVRQYRCGFVCNPTVESLAKTILVAKQQPQSVLDIMGQNARRLAESVFDLRVVGREYFDFIQERLSAS